jgi:hypothetical protein
MQKWIQAGSVGGLFASIEALPTVKVVGDEKAGCMAVKPQPPDRLEPSLLALPIAPGFLAIGILGVGSLLSGLIASAIVLAVLGD